MKRSGDVTASAVLLFFGSGLLVLFSALALLAMILPSAVRETKSQIFLGLLIYALFAAWGIATGVGVLMLKPWARISILILSGFTAVGILFAATGMVLVVPIMEKTPNMQPGFARVFLAGILLFLLVPLAIAIWWLILFTRKRVALEFAAGRTAENNLAAAIGTTPAPQSSAGGSVAVIAAPQMHGATISPSTVSPAKLPTSILVIAILLVAGSAFAILESFYIISRHMPYMFFGLFVKGGPGTALYLLMVGAELFLGIILLRKWSWAVDAVIGFNIFMAINLLFVLSPHVRQTMLSVTMKHSPYAKMMPAVESSHMAGTGMMSGLVFGALVIVVELYFLITRRKAYRAACAAKNASPPSSPQPSQPTAPSFPSTPSGTPPSSELSQRNTS